MSRWTGSQTDKCIEEFSLGTALEIDSAIKIWDFEIALRDNLQLFLNEHHLLTPIDDLLG